MVEGQRNGTSKRLKIFHLQVYKEAKASVFHPLKGEADIWLSFFVSVSRDGRHSKGTEDDVLQDHLLPHPERRAPQRLHHHTDDHHVCREYQPGLEGSETDKLKLERLINKWAASISAHSSLGWAGTWMYDGFLFCFFFQTKPNF